MNDKNIVNVYIKLDKVYRDRYVKIFKIRHNLLQPLSIKQINNIKKIFISEFNKHKIN